MTYFVRSLGFHDDGVLIDYAALSDVRANGMVQNHTLFIPALDANAELLDELVDAVHLALARGLVDWTNAPEVEPANFDDNAPSPYDNPNEREGVTG